MAKSILDGVSGVVGIDHVDGVIGDGVVMEEETNVHQ